MKKITFLSESGFTGYIPREFNNMRTEYSWYSALKAYHHPITQYESIKGYDYVVIIWPKGETTVNSEGSSINLIKRKPLLSELLKLPIIDTLKRNNGKVCYMQEGNSSYFQDYELNDQVNYINVLNDSDILFVHNEYDVSYYKGLCPNKPIHVLPTLMIEDSIKHLKWKPQNKTIVGGNMSRWYNGFSSYLMSLNFDNEIYIPSSHSKRQGEEQLDRLHHLPYMNWFDWMNELSTYKYAIHLMPTIAAGTFSLNCSYFGIPCIGNEKVDTQKICQPYLSVDVDDLDSVRELALKLKTDESFYKKCSEYAKISYKENFHESVFDYKMKEVFI